LARLKRNRLRPATRKVKHLPNLTILLLALICAYFIKSANWEGPQGDQWKEQFSSGDAKGYYAYLPEYFIKHDLSKQDPKFLYVNKTAYGNVDKYFIGNSLLWSPFFGATYIYAKLSHQSADGYSEPFKKMISIAALFWLLIGLSCLSGILRSLHFSDLLISITLILITLGTNLFHYVVMEPAMSHVYSFSMLCILMYCGMRYFRTERKLDLLICTLAFTIGVLLRPTNLLWMICLLPFIAGGMGPLRQKLLRPGVLLIVLPAAGFLCFLQLGAYYLETGHWFLRTYSDEGFYLFRPEIIQVLVGFKKGWFVYTPLAALAMIGFVPLYRQNKTAFYSFLSSFVILLLTISTWWSWFYAESFGHRGFIDLYPILAILLAYTLNYLPAKLGRMFPFLTEQYYVFILRSACWILLTINLIQTYQYYNHILEYDCMDWNRYKFVFLKTSSRYESCLGGTMDMQPYSTQNPKQIYHADNTFAQPVAGWNTMPLGLLNGKKVLHFAGEEYGAVLTIPTDSSYTAGKKLFARMSITRYEEQKNASSGVMLVVEIWNSKHEQEFYNAFPINDFPADREQDLRTFHSNLEIPCPADPSSTFKIYIWNKKKQDFYLTDIKIDLEEILP